MGREFIDGFEHGSMQLWDVVNAGWSAVTGVAGCSGSYCAKSNSGGQIYMTKYLTARNAYYLAFKFYNLNASGTSNYNLIQFTNGSTVLGSLSYNSNNASNGYLSLWRGSQANLLGSTGNIIPMQTWTLVELYYLPATDSTGQFVLKVNGVTQLSYTNTQTSNNALQINQLNVIHANNTMYWDDFVLDSVSWVGSTQIQALIPNGAGASTQWTPSSGNNYACVGKSTPNDTTYVDTNTTSNIDTYGCNSLSGTIGSIKTVQVVFRGNFSGAPTPTTVTPVVRTNSTNYFGTAKTMPSSFAGFSNLWDTNPNTGLAWTSSDVNALQIGIEATA